jgi:thiosulfate dehydrogenase [quinone] large subunit
MITTSTRQDVSTTATTTGAANLGVAEATRTGVFPHPELDYESPSARGTRYAGAALRLSLGSVFLWAFLDKTFALGFSTGRNPETGIVDVMGEAAWLNGASPTEGFLTYGTSGPFAGFFQGFAGAAWADALFMLGLLGIGLALIAGIGVRVAAVSGAAMMIMMWSAALWPENHPFMDDHIVYAIALGLVAFMGAGRTWGFGKQWERLPLVTRHGWLK